MNIKNTISLHDKEISSDFYEKRYQDNYMEDWPIKNKNRLTQIIKNLNLPAEGNAIDFGCGNGPLTQIIKSALPSWNVYGIDISHTAIENAEKRFPECNFFLPSDKIISKIKFDFLFTHHVLEHVSNIESTFYEIKSLLKTNSSMLHILPCGNFNSFEHNLCLLIKDGINHSVGNRYFFEDESHLRRLTSSELIKHSNKIGFKISKEYYYYHYYGAIEWITSEGKEFILKLTDYKLAINKIAKVRLVSIRLYLLFFIRCKNHFQFFQFLRAIKKKNIYNYFSIIISIPTYLISKYFIYYQEKKSSEEWILNRHKPNGSEMSLFFKK